MDGAAFWWQVDTSGAPSLTRFKMWSHNDTLYLFGGVAWSWYSLLTMNEDTYYFQDIPGNRTWVPLPASSPAPVGRMDYSLVVYKGKAYMYGGYSGSWLDDFWSFDPSTGNWTQIIATGDKPADRVGHDAAVYGDYMYMLGGKNIHSQYIMTLHRYNFLTNSWSKLSTAPMAPRELFTLTEHFGKLYLYAGYDMFNDVIYDDLWAYDPGLNTWENITSIAPELNLRRYLHTTISLDNRLFIFGGYSGIFPNIYIGYDALLEWDLDLRRWLTPNILGIGPVGRFGQGMARAGNITYFFAGNDMYTQKSDLWATSYIRPKCEKGTYSPIGDSLCYGCPAGFVSDDGAYHCDICPAGTYTNGDKQAECIPCPPGYYGLSPGSGSFAACTPCPIGYASNKTAADSADTCQPCPAGHYAPDTVSTVCYACPAGTENQNEAQLGLEACIDCTSGTFSHEGWPACIDCSAGFFSGPIASNCTQCGPGTYSESGASECSNCPAGTYQEIWGAESFSDCLSCPAGWYQTDVGQPACIACPDGHYSTAIRATSFSVCTKCPKGTYNPLYGSGSLAFCIDCTNGTFADAEGLSACLDCPKGTYSTTIRAVSNSTCIDCPSGTYGERPGVGHISGCAPCAAGYYSPPGLPDCLPCPNGTFVSEKGSLSVNDCKNCLPGTYSGKGADKCTTCPPDTFSHYGFENCIPCSVNTPTATTGTTLSGFVRNGAMQDVDPINSTIPIRYWTPSSNNAYYKQNDMLVITNTASSQSKSAHQRIYSQAKNPIAIRMQSSSVRVAPLSGPAGSREWSVDFVIRLKNGVSVSFQHLYNTHAGSTTQQYKYSDYDPVKEVIDYIDVTVKLHRYAGTVAFDNLSIYPLPTVACNCTDGYYHEVGNTGYCNWCKHSNFCVDGGMFQCYDGEYSSGGRSDCLPCIPGWICIMGDAQPCAANEYVANNTCTACEPGYRCLQGIRTICGVGSYGTGSRYCSLCQPGTYADKEGSPSCKVCADGWTSNYRRTSCVPCGAGTYSTEGRACSSCPIGSFSATSMSSDCTLCPQDTYGQWNAAYNSSTCAACPAGQTASPGAASLSECH